MSERFTMCPDCDYPLRAEEPTATGLHTTFLVCHMCSKGWSLDEIVQFMIDNPPKQSNRSVEKQ